MKTRELITVSNAIIKASYRLSLAEHRLIALSIVKAQKCYANIEDLKDQELIITAEEYAVAFDVSPQTAYKALQDGALNLFERKFSFQYLEPNGANGLAVSRFVQQVNYVHENGYVALCFAKAFIPHLMELNKRYTQYGLQNIKELKSSQSIRFYEFFMQFKATGWLEVSLEDLRFRLGIDPSEYKAMSNFKRRVLNASIDEINAKSDIVVSYTQKKAGRKIVGFRFEFTPKISCVPSHEDSNLLAQTPELNPDLTPEENKVAHQAGLDYINKSGIADETHQQNILKKAVKEGWGVESHQQKQDELVRKAEAENERKLKNLAIAKEEQDRKDKINQENEDFKKAIEQALSSLPEDSIPLLLSMVEAECRNHSEFLKNLWAYTIDNAGNDPIKALTHPAFRAIVKKVFFNSD